MAVIEIKLHEDLISPKKNELRARMEMCIWLGNWRKAKEENDHRTMDWLDKEFERIGLP